MTAHNRDINRLTGQIIGGAIRVHRHLGPGLLESTYHACLAAELRHLGLRVEEELPVGVRYRDVELEYGYRIDILVERAVVVELKAVTKLEPVHTAQLLTYLRLSALEIGLLLNFNVAILAAGGIRRVVRGRTIEKPSAGLDRPDSHVGGR